MREPRSKKSSVVATVTLLILLGIVLLFCGGFYFHEAGQIKMLQQTQERSRVDALSHLFESELRAISHDLRELASGDGLHAYIKSGQASDLERAVRRAVTYSRLNPEYGQIRYLDERGHEVLRVNRGGAVVSSGDLQDKSSRRYFQQAFKLAPGQMYLSALDLNVENGQIEQPPKPMLRFAMPVFDDGGQCRGVYVINCLAAEIFSRIQQYRPDLQPRLRVINPQGYWIKGSRPDEEWGFMYPDRKEHTLAQSNPVLWTQIAGQPKGLVPYDGGLLAWQHVDLRRQIAETPDAVVADDAFLVIALQTSEAEFAALFARLRTVFGIMTTLLLALTFAASRLSYSWRRTFLDLRRSEEDLAVTLHSLGDAVLTTDAQRRVVRLNPVAERLTGWTQAEAQGHPVSEVFHIINEETREPAVIPVDEVLVTGEVQGLANHTVLIARDGKEWPIADSAAPIRDQGGPILGVVLVFRDVSAERETEKRIAALLREMKDVRTALDEHAIVSIANPAGRITYANDKFCTISKYAREELLGNEHRIVNSGHHPKSFFRELWVTITAGRVWQGEIRNRAKDGTIFWANTTIVPFLDSDGKPEQFISIQTDITKRKRAEEELDRFFNVSLDFLCIASADGYFKRASPAVTDILGWTQEEFLSRPFMEYVHPEDHVATQREVERQVVAGEKVLRFDNRYRHKDGSWRVLSWRSVPQPGGLMYATARDVTDLRNKEEYILSLNSDLRIRAAQLEAVNGELEAFSYSVSHDLRAPLRHIQGYAEMLVRATEGKLPDSAQRHLNTIIEVGAEMGKLIDDLLAFSRMSRVSMQEGTVELDALVQGVIDSLKPATQRRHVEWNVQPLPRVTGDSAMLKQVFMNLISNALKYTSHRPTAVVEIGVQGYDDGNVVIFVRDNGAGFDMKYAHKLFGVFQRLHRADEFEGTGIGLAIVRRIVGRHGGRVWAESEVDKGATFYVTLRPVA